MACYTCFQEPCIFLKKLIIETELRSGLLGHPNALRQPIAALQGSLDYTYKISDKHEALLIENLRSFVQDESYGDSLYMTDYNKINLVKNPQHWTTPLKRANIPIGTKFEDFTEKTWKLLLQSISKNINEEIAYQVIVDSPEEISKAKKQLIPEAKAIEQLTSTESTSNDTSSSMSQQIKPNQHSNQKNAHHQPKAEVDSPEENSKAKKRSGGNNPSPWWQSPLSIAVGIALSLVLCYLGYNKSRSE